jgi:hypothetical protein
MTAYGLAFVSILWSRLDFVASTPMLRNVHHMIIIAICALPLILSLPQKVRVGMTLRDRGGVPQWPPYYAPPLNSKTSGIKGWVDAKHQVVFSDQPWAVAWYADRVSIWLPPTVEGFSKLESVAADLQTPVAGIHISPSSHSSEPISVVLSQYKDFASLVMDGMVIEATYPASQGTFDKSPKLQEIAKHYFFRRPMVGGKLGTQMMFYSDRAISNSNE